MPKALHNKVARAARKKGLRGKGAESYIYGTMENIKQRGGIKGTRKRGRGVAKP